MKKIRILSGISTGIHFLILIPMILMGFAAERLTNGAASMLTDVSGMAVRFGAIGVLLGAEGGVFGVVLGGVMLILAIVAAGLSGIPAIWGTIVQLLACRETGRKPGKFAADAIVKLIAAGLPTVSLLSEFLSKDFWTALWPIPLCLFTLLTLSAVQLRECIRFKREQS